MEQKIESILYKVNKPSRYIGNESGSANKDWDSASVRVAMGFPDTYEIGISNLGLRILYDKINNHKDNNFLADRVYAPETDFKEQSEENNLPLYGLESKRSLKEFDVIAFSLQYELSYPTLLSMLEQGGIPYKNASRKDDDPIIIAGGPGSYNPAPVSDYIDAFIIGDGESAIIEILEVIDDAKKVGKTRQEILTSLSKLRGIYISSLHKEGQIIDKRIDEVDHTNYPVNFPVPFSPGVHDRAVVEIRRGCGRMCRFCQPCFVNFPIRERSPENIVCLIDESIANTGYEEYSLLSLSSNDYGNIENLVRTLNKKHAPNGTSISLPSQRADKFSLELAQEVQAVRKSTITIAAEAGSQRLRNVINKNLTKEQILNAVLSTYKAGWQHIKMYFIMGLPTETYEDLDAMIELLNSIRYHAKNLKKELGLANNLTITCTVSIFVPKSFTPFQWAGQENSEKLWDKIKYIREKAKILKGVRLNFHDVFLSKLEAVFSRGDKDLNQLIELVYQKGSYLDAWKEHFNKQLWLEAAEELGICLDEYAERTYTKDDKLPWEMINTGVKKEWLANEYNKALEDALSVPCEEACSNCGVCSEFGVKPSIKSREQESECHPELVSGSDTQPEKLKVYSEIGYKYRLKVEKTGPLKFISHLDWQRMFYYAIKKAGLKINYSQGFNPSPKISVGIALPLFVESKGEYIDIELQEKIADNIIKDKLNKVLPLNSQISSIINIPKDKNTIEKRVCWAVYTATPEDVSKLQGFDVETIAKEFLLKDNIIVERPNKKKPKKGPKKIDLRPGLHSMNFDKTNNTLRFTLKAGVADINPGSPTPLGQDKVSVSSVRADEFVNLLTPDMNWRITRESLLDNNFNELISD